MPIPIDIRRLDEGKGIAATMLEQIGQVAQILQSEI